jgi:hypothetical protein
MTVELTKEQKAFLDWAAKLEGVTPQEYLLRAVRGKLVKITPGGNWKTKKQPWGLIWVPV